MPKKDDIQAHVDAALHQHFVGIGRAGGSAKSAAKRAAAKENAKKAIAARWGKKPINGR